MLELVRARPRILRGLWKNPRPIYAWIVPLLVTLPLVATVVQVWPAAPFWVLYGLTMAGVLGGTCWLSMGLAVAPGILRYRRTGAWLRKAAIGDLGTTAQQDRMAALGVAVKEFARARKYEDDEAGTRLVVREKRTLPGAAAFLTSSEEIGNCVALRNFVAWTLPSYLADDGVMLVDVYCRGTRQSYTQRGQVWLVAAERDGAPVLAVNSMEFNNEGAKYMELLLPKIVDMLRDGSSCAGAHQWPGCTRWCSERSSGARGDGQGLGHSSTPQATSTTSGTSPWRFGRSSTSPCPAIPPRRSPCAGT